MTDDIKAALKSPLNSWIIKPAHSEKEHIYEIDGELVPSVTTVLKVLDKPALVPWAAAQTVRKATELLARRCDKDGTLHISFAEAQEIMEEAKKKYRETSSDARDIGSMVHQAIEDLFLGKPPTPVNDEGVANGLIAFTQWKEAHKIRPVRVEALVGSKKYKFGGAVDLIGFVDGILTVGDHKTSTSAHYEEYKLQISAYAAAVEEQTGKKIPQGMVVRFDKKTGTFDPKKDVMTLSRKEMVSYFKMFKGLLGFYHAKQDFLAQSKAKG